MKEQYNVIGKELSPDEQFLPADPRFFTDPTHPDWNQWIQHGDEWGFDIRCVLDDQDNYIVRIVLPEGKRIIRYGLDLGKFTTDIGTEYDSLSLPYAQMSVPYHEYTVIGECEVECYVDKGIVAPGFEKSGGAVQYRHYMTINESLRRGVLKEDFSWLKQMWKKKK